MTSILLPKRRSLLRAGALAPLAWAVPRVSFGSEAPIKIALVTSLSGPFAALGESMRAGLELLLAESGQQMGGRPVQLLVEDDNGRPDEAVRKVRKLVGQDRVDIICGVISAAVALAIRDIVTESKTLTFISCAAANALARDAASPYIFRPTKTSWMLSHPAALWVHENVDKSGGITMASDYAAGREYIGDFSETYQAQGGSLGKTLWTPLGTTDFAPLIMNVAAMNPKFIYAFFPGADGVRFLRQMQDFRLRDKIQVIGPGALFDQEDVLPAAGQAGLGGINAYHQSPMAQASAEFAKAYMAKRGRLPGESSTAGYATGQVIKAGLDAVDGDVSQRDKIKAHLLSQPIKTAFGEMAFNPRNNQAILDIYINRVEKAQDGTLLNTVIHTYPGVSDPGPAA